MSSKKTKPAAHAGSPETLLDPNSSAFFKELMDNPVKRALVLELLEQQKTNIKEYKKKESKKLQELRSSPLKKLKSRLVCESPTTLMRRRALEKLQKENTDSASEKSSSESSYRTASTSSPQPVAFEDLLKGVVAYVEIKSNGEDRSAGAKALMRSMGAVISEKLTSGVTHVVFKDGSFTTYQKAKLLKIPMVSILWLEATRRNHAREPEKNYPALGTEAYQNNMSTICSQMQKEYEEVVKEDMRRSIALNVSSFSSKKSFIAEKRRKTMLPYIRENSRSSSNSSERSNICENVDSQELSDHEICSITKGKSNELKGSIILANASPEISSDNSDCGIADGDLNYSKRKSIRETPDIQELIEIIVLPDSPNNSDMIPTTKSSNDDSGSLLTKKQPRTLSVLESDMELTRIDSKPLDQITTLNSSIELTRINDSSVKHISSDRSTNISDESLLKNREKRFTNSVGSNMSELRISDQNKGDSSKQSAMSSLRISDGKKTNTSDTKSSSEMSSLQISSKSSNEIKIISNVIVKKPESRESAGVDIFNPRVQINSEKDSFSPMNDVVSNVLKSLNEDIENSTRPSRKNKPENDGSNKIVNKKKLKKSDTAGNSNNDSSIRDSISENNTRRNRRQTETKENRDKKYATCKKKHRITNASSNSSSENISTDSNIESSSKKLRKLYNPNESLGLDMQCDEEERSRKRLIKQNDLIIKDTPVPYVLLSTHLINKKNTEHPVASSTDSDEPSVTNTKKRSAKVSKRSVKKRCSSEDEQKQLTADLVDMKLTIKTTPNLNKRTSPKRNTTVFKTPNKNPKKKVQNLKKLNTSVCDTENKIPDSTRKSLRLSQRPRRVYTNSSSSISDSDKCAEITPRLRRSTLDFQSNSLSSLKKKKTEKKRIPTIVCTKFHKDQCQLFKQIVKKLGNFRVEDEVSDQTTHLVAGESKRTINMLRAIARGCWILKHEWLLKSLENGKWLPEEGYEATDFSPAVQQCRLQRQAFRESYAMDIFENCGNIFIARSTIPRCSDLKELVTLCKGTITVNSNDAVISVGEYIDSKEVVSVSEAWILDSITFNKRKSTKPYLLNPKA